jgi:hypothetical protein
LEGAILDIAPGEEGIGEKIATNDSTVVEEAHHSFRGVFPKVPCRGPKEFFDNRFLKELEDSGFVQELYGKR